MKQATQKQVIKVYSDRFFNIYASWATNRMSKKQAQESAKFARKQMKEIGVKLEDLDIDHNILADLGLYNKLVTLKTQKQVAKFVFCSPIIEANNRWSIMGIDLEINPEQYKQEKDRSLQTKKKLVVYLEW